MKKLAYLFTVVIFSLNLVAQTSDSIKVKKANAVNYYSPFHKTNDSATSVSKLGHYISIGSGAQYDYKYSGVALLRALGGSHNYKANGAVMLASYSLAYKSHLITATFNTGSYGANNSATSGYTARYFGCLYGQSMRYKHLIVSVSAGVAVSYLMIVRPLIYEQSSLTYEWYGKISIPIEIKAFWLARNGVGVGIHLAENIVPTPKYSPFYAGLSIVFGVWNKAKPKRI